MRGLFKIGGIVALLAVAAPVGAAGAVSSKDQALLNAGVVTASDVPATWQSTKQPDTGLSQLKKLPTCQRYRAMVTAARKNPFKLSPQFNDPSNGGGTLAEDTVYAFKSTVAATRYVTPVLGGSAVQCLQTLLAHELGGQGQVGPFTPLSGLQGVGDQRGGYESVITIPGQGTLVVDEVGVRVGRAFVGFTFTNPATTITEGPGVVNAVVNRLTEAGA